MLEARGLDVARGGAIIVADVTLHAGAGRALLVHGANGCGKTSLIATLAGLLPPARGAVCWHGTRTHDSTARFHRDLAYLGHTDGLCGELTVLENLRFAGLLGACMPHDAAREKKVLAAAGLFAVRRMRLDRLSQGQRRRAALARLVLAGKALWLLDEPTDALDDAACAWFASCADTHVRRGGTVIAATHRPLALTPAHTQHFHLARSGPCSR
jgi:heme exporter protein A